VRAREKLGGSDLITRLTIENFRGFKSLSLEGLRRVNLLVGGNDTGKTSVLESLVLLLGDGQAIQSLPTEFRRTEGGGVDFFENFWLWMFYDHAPERGFSLNVEGDDGTRVSVVAAPKPHASAQQNVIRRFDGQSEHTLLLYQAGSVNTHGGAEAPPRWRASRLSVKPTSPVHDAEKYNLVALDPRGEEKIERIMSEIEPRLRRLRYAKLPGTNHPLVFADIGLSRAVPSTQMGEAFNRILHIYAEIMSAKANVLLIDEIENGIFTEALLPIWRGLMAICEEEDVQIFATTHSRECVMAAFTAAAERNKDDLCVQRLQRVKGEIEAVRLDARHLEVARELDLEVRA
jgi:AAA ATPase-like protein